MSNKTSDNVANIEDDIEILESIVKVHNDFLQGVDKESINEKEIRALEHVLLHYKNMQFNYENLIHDISLIAESLDMQEDSTIEEIAIRISEEMYNQQQINEEHKKLNGELRERVKELEEKNKHLSNVSDYETISLECTNLEEQLEIANDKIKELEEELEKANRQLDLDYVDENFISKQVVIDVLQNNRNELFSMTYLSKEQYRPYEMQIERINKIEQELLGGVKNNENIKS